MKKNITTKLVHSKVDLRVGKTRKTNIAVNPTNNSKKTTIYLKFLSIYLKAYFILQYSNKLFSDFSILIMLINSFSYAKS